MSLDNVVLPIEILTYSHEEGTVNGHVVTRGAYTTIHEACIALTVPYAQQVGVPVLTHAVDTIGPPAEYWLHVHPNGRATPADPDEGRTNAAGPITTAGPIDAAAPDGPSPEPQLPDQAAPGSGHSLLVAPSPSPGTLPSTVTGPEPTAEPAPRMIDQQEPPAAARSGRRHAAEGPAPRRSPTLITGPPPTGMPRAGTSKAADPEPEPFVPASSWVPPTLDDLLATRPPPPAGPAQLGWRAGLRKATGGAITLGPSTAEITHRQAIAAVQRSLSGPKTVVVINPKGGANKTTATLLLAATFGIHRGGYTLAWDNNETRGTMGWRANQGRHTNTAVDLLRELDRFEDARSARVGDLDNFVRSQGSAQFDVLASDEDAASAASIDAEAFNALHQSLSRFYRMIVVDTGNNMRASNWDAAVNAADQIVIVSTIREDTAQSAAWVADGLHEKGFSDKVANAVTILAAPSLRPDPALTSRLEDHFGLLTRAVVQVPFDPALVSGGPIRVEALSTASREAWLEATAQVADGL